MNPTSGSTNHSDRILTIPNALSLVRIVAAPYIGYFVVHSDSEDTVSTALLISIFFVTDWLDGFLARRLNQQSRLGSILDPTGDKMLTISLACSFRSLRLMSPLVANTLILRDALLLLASFIMCFQNCLRVGGKGSSIAALPHIKPTRLGKVNTALVAMLFLLCLLKHGYSAGDSPALRELISTLHRGAHLAIIATTLLSLLSYAVQRNECVTFA